MPCRCDGPETPEERAWRENREREKMEAYTKQRRRDELDRVGAMLCSVCRIVEKRGWLQELPPDVLEWWEQHKIEDRRRNALESQQRSILLMTPEERERLGIHSG
jgi:hypothetical protein